MFQIVSMATVFYDQLVADIVWLNGRANSVCSDRFGEGKTILPSQISNHPMGLVYLTYYLPT